MVRSWLAPKPVDRPVLAGIVLDPLFREFITLTPYNERRYEKEDIGHEQGAGSYADYSGFLIGSDTFAGVRTWQKGQINTSILIHNMKYTVG